MDPETGCLDVFAGEDPSSQSPRSCLRSPPRLHKNPSGSVVGFCFWMVGEAPSHYGAIALNRSQGISTQVSVVAWPRVRIIALARAATSSLEASMISR